jgi:recombination protein RecA
MTQRSEIDAAIAKLKKDYGDRTVARVGDEEIVPVDAIPTGIFSLDRAFGCGGWPRGRICEIYGPESSSKSGVMLKSIATAQSMKLEAALVDAEQSADLIWAERAFGVQPEPLVMSQPETAEQAFGIIEGLVKAKIDLIVVDSVEGLVPRAEMEGDFGESQMGVKARIMSQALRKLKDPLANAQTALVFINQIREKVGVVFGSPEITTGGRALKFWASLRVDMRRTNKIKEGDSEVGIHLKARVVKNKVARPFGETEFDYYSGKCECHAEGFDLASDLLEAGIAAGVIVKEGNTYSFAGERLAVGRAAAAKQCENLKLADAVKAAVRKAGA